MQALVVSPSYSPSTRRLSPSFFSVSSVKRSTVNLSCSRISSPSFKCSAVTSVSATSEEAVRFAEASKRGNLVPLYRCIFSDHLTPVLAYRCLVREDDREAPSFLFESVEQGFRGSNVGRFSVVGAQPTMEVVAKENAVVIMDHEEGKRTEEIAEDPMAVPRRIMEDWTPQLIDELPDAFCGGWVGYFSYDTVRYVEKKKLLFSSAPEDDRKLPDVHLGLYDDVIVFDHVEKKAYVIHWVRLDKYSSVEEAYNDGMNRLQILLSRVQNIDPPRLAAGSVKLYTRLFGSSLKRSSMTSDAYKEAVLQAKEHILAGDIFQIVLSQRFERRTFADPFEVYRALRVVNPSPYMTYLQARGCILVASSPEILTRAKKGRIINRPLAGTVRRGKTEEEDKMLERQLLNDGKQCAEHIMLVDLGRNDVGKVSKPGSVKVEKLMNIERYSHVMHISSTVTGELLDHLTSWDALRAALPVGTVSGAPKVKAMELIDQLEVTRRGPYSGGFGGVSFTGDMDIALALRTIVFPTSARYDTMYSYRDANSRREWVAHIQPLRHSFPKSALSSSPTSTLISPPHSPTSDSPPLSPNSPSIRRPMLSNSVNEVLALSLRQLQLSKSKSPPASWAMHQLGSSSPRGMNLRPMFSSLPSTPTAPSTPTKAASGGIGWTDIWEKGCFLQQQEEEKEEPMERVESGRNLRAKIYEKLSKENSVEIVETNAVVAAGAPDVGWVSELVK